MKENILTAIILLREFTKALQLAPFFYNCKKPCCKSGSFYAYNLEFQMLRNTFNKLFTLKTNNMCRLKCGYCDVTKFPSAFKEKNYPLNRLSYASLARITHVMKWRN